VSEASPDLTAVAIVVSALWLFTILDQRGTTRVSIGIGLLLGLLMLIKGQYGVLMTGWVVLFLRRRYRATVISFIAHILPLLGWIGLLNLWGLEYYNHEIEYFHQIVWIWEEFIHWPLSQQLHYWIVYTVDYMREFGKAFGPIIIFAAAWGLWQRENRKWWLLTVVALFMNYWFLFAIQRPSSYLTALTFFVVYPLSAWVGVRLSSKYPASQWRWMLIYLGFCWITGWAAWVL
jgi:hypothetical protein